MNEHTPSPWIWQNGCSWWRLGTLYGDGDVLRPEVMRDGWPTLVIPNGGPTGPDASLIAAAPDLLEALKEIYKQKNNGRVADHIEAIAPKVIRQADGKWR